MTKIIKFEKSYRGNIGIVLDKNYNGPFCSYHIKTKENPKGTDCTAHLDAGRADECPFTINKIQYKKDENNKLQIYISQKKGNDLVGACQDFKLLENIVIVP